MYYLSNRSLGNLEGVEAPLVSLIKILIEYTPIDFAVIEGLRTIEKQAEYFKAGKSHTMLSKHLVGRAVDLMAYHAGEGTWDKEHYYTLIDALIPIAHNANIPIRWGGAWHIEDITRYAGSAQEASEEYIKLRESQGRKPFLDFPHVELA